MDKQSCRADTHGPQQGSSSEGETEPLNTKETLGLAKPHPQLCRSSRVYRPSFSQSSLLQDTNNESEFSPAYRAKMDFALKLGYSAEQVGTVLDKLGPGALINDVLAELVRLGSKGETEGHVPSSGGSLTPRSPEASLEEDTMDTQDNLRPVVIDGSNVAMSHGAKEVFSCRGIQLAVEWFLEKGHSDITVFVPAWRKEQSRPDAPITDQEILRKLEKEKILVFTPSRRVQGRRVVCYDDRFIVKLAYDSDGIIVSNDNYRDLQNEKPEWKKFIEERLLMYSFVNDKFMPPDDPLGRHGPSLENFLRKRPVVPEHKKQPCPYGKKCTYGHKCKYYHPERPQQPLRSVADELRAFAKLTAVKTVSEGAKASCASEVKRVTPKRQSDPIIRPVACEPEERLLAARRPEASSTPSLVTALSVPAALPARNHASAALNARSASSPAPCVSRFAPNTHLSPNPQVKALPLAGGYESFPECDCSSDRGYCSMLSDFSSLSLGSFCSTEHDTDSTVEEPLLSHRPQVFTHAFGQEEPSPNMLHPALAARSSCPGDCSGVPGRALGMTRMDSVSDSRLHESSSARLRRPPLCREQHAGWEAPLCTLEPYMQPYVRLCCERAEHIWRLPWEGCAVPEQLYQTYRNLCNIFPAYVVQAVMEKNPHMSDPQELAAVIVSRLRAER